MVTVRGRCCVVVGLMWGLATLCVGGSLWAQAPGGQASKAAGTPVAAVIDELLSARSELGPLEGQLSWVVTGPRERRRKQGRVYIKDADRFAMQFTLGQAGVGGMGAVVVPDGRWVYEHGTGASLGVRLDLARIEERTGSLAPRVQYDLTGGALLRVLRRRLDVLYEGDQEREGEVCRVLSHHGGSLRLVAPGPATEDSEAGPASTRLYFRLTDGLLVGEEEFGSEGQVLSTYRLFELRAMATLPEGLLELPEGVHFLDLTRQLSRRLLHGPPGGVPVGPPGPSVPGPQPDTGARLPEG